MLLTRKTATAITIAALAALTPTVTCLIGIVLAGQDVRDLRSEMDRGKNDLRAELRGEMSGLRAELKVEMAGLRTELKGEIAGLRGDMVQMRKDVHADLRFIHERGAIVEGRQGR